MILLVTVFVREDRFPLTLGSLKQKEAVRSERLNSKASNEGWR